MYNLTSFPDLTPGSEPPSYRILYPESVAAKPAIGMTVQSNIAMNCFMSLTVLSAESGLRSCSGADYTASTVPGGPVRMFPAQNRNKAPSLHGSELLKHRAVHCRRFRTPVLMDRSRFVRVKTAPSGSTEVNGHSRERVSRTCSTEFKPVSSDFLGRETRWNELGSIWAEY